MLTWGGGFTPTPGYTAKDEQLGVLGQELGGFNPLLDNLTLAFSDYTGPDLLCSTVFHF